MDAHLIEALGDELFSALQTRKSVAPLSQRHADISLDDAYRISLRLLARREAMGERVIGKKIGVTSRAVQEMLDVHQPDFGFLTDRMQVAGDSDVSFATHRLIQPRAEGEIAFVLGDDLKGGEVSADDVLAATEWVLPCFEIVDSRIDNWQIRIQDTVADNPRELDLAQVQLQLFKNGHTAGSGLGAAVQGHPCNAVAWLANTLGKLGIPFRKGEIILSGALAPLVPVAAGDFVSLSLSGMGVLHLNFVP